MAMSRLSESAFETVIEALSHARGCHVALIKERRMALIGAEVTGKIEAREVTA